MKSRGKQGVALVVTLILLAVITIVVVAFLAVTQRNRSLISTSSDFIDAKLMAEAALNRAQAQIASRMIANTNVAAFSLLVSTNIDVIGDPGDETELLDNLQALRDDPRPPVFVATNQAIPFARDFRFYLDLNRNGRFDPTGEQEILDDLGNPGTPDRLGRTMDTFNGDPQWIGVLEHPDQPHSSSNRFIGRFAFLVAPEGLALDLNGIHNNARRLPGPFDGFARNMGVGTWENNLAGFLVGLNNNYWPGPGQTGARPDYLYNVGNLQAENRGFAFEDASTLLSYRVRANPTDPASSDFGILQSVAERYPNLAGPFQTDLLDQYSDGPLMLGEYPPTAASVPDPVTEPWSGSIMPQEYFAVDELFDVNKTGNQFVTRLESARNSLSTYNNTTYYRLLSQLGTSAGQEPASFRPGFHEEDMQGDFYRPREKINLNYDNRDLRDDPNASDPLVRTAADAIPWQPLAFFTNAADRLLRSQGFVGSDGRTISLTNIMVWPTNNYDAAVHRCLQVAANLFDATTNYWGVALPGQPELPSVFRPVLRRETVNGREHVYVDGFVSQNEFQGGNPINPAGFVSRVGYLDLNDPTDRARVDNEPTRLALGVPMVIGAKKGYPNFNELAIQTVAQAQRNLILRRLPGSSEPDQTNQMYILSVSNVIGAELWNSYETAFPRDLQMAIEVDVSSAVLNSSNQLLWPLVPGIDENRTYAVATNYAAGTWGGEGFRVPILTNHFSVTNSIWQSTGRPFRSVSEVPEGNAAGTFSILEPGFPIPDWQVQITNRVRYVLTDGGRIVDFVNIGNMTNRINVIEILSDSNPGGGDAPGGGETRTLAQMWNMNRIGGSADVDTPTLGIDMQINASAGWADVSAEDWAEYSPQIRDRESAQTRFQSFLLDAGVSGYMQAPFTAGRKVFVERKFAVNDPLVHYTFDDLNDLAVFDDEDPPYEFRKMGQPIPSMDGDPLRRVNDRYSPWGGGDKGAEGNLAAYNPGFTDPGVDRSDAWVFPNSRFPSVGWMGRVHRGSPWQTIYLKSLTRARVTDAPATGVGSRNGFAVTNEPIVTVNAWIQERGNPRTYPSGDWAMLDLFTTAPTPSATRGQLSVNQSGEAGWGAVLSGVNVLTNDVNGVVMDPGDLSVSASLPSLIEPGTQPFLDIVDGINRTREFGNNGFFASKGAVLSTPELSISSPYLAANYEWENPERARAAVAAGLTDIAMERIPQQIMSLLRLGDPRIVIYAYGQSLSPARNSINLDPNYYQMVTNYQITGEHVIRTVVRFEPDEDNDNGEANLVLRAVVEDSKVLPPE